MNHIVIPYRYSEHEELRYVLRSIDQNCSFAYDITIIGYKPDWVTNVNHIKYDDNAHKRYENLFNKISIAMENFESFFWWHDDEFLLKPILAEKLKRIYALQDLNQVDNFGDRWFQQQLKLFKEEMNNLHHPAHNYCTHTPFYFETRKLNEVLGFFGISERKTVTFIENYYFNYFKKHLEAFLVHPIKIGKYDDTKITEEDFEGKIFANFDEDGIKSGIFDYLKDKFNTPSKFEK